MQNHRVVSLVTISGGSMSLKLVLVTVLFFLSACVQHHKAEDFDLAILEVAIRSLNINSARSVASEEWPKEIKDLNPKSIRIDETGVYIVLRSFWVEESGIFYPVNSGEFSEYTDPSYKLLGNNLYSYLIRA